MRQDPELAEALDLRVLLRAIPRLYRLTRLPPLHPSLLLLGLPALLLGLPVPLRLCPLASRPTRRLG